MNCARGDRHRRAELCPRDAFPELALPAPHTSHARDTDPNRKPTPAKLLLGRRGCRGGGRRERSCRTCQRSLAVDVLDVPRARDQWSGSHAEFQRVRPRPPARSWEAISRVCVSPAPRAVAPTGSARPCTPSSGTDRLGVHSSRLAERGQRCVVIPAISPMKIAGRRRSATCAHCLSGSAVARRPGAPLDIRSPCTGDTPVDERQSSPARRSDILITTPSRSSLLPTSAARGPFVVVSSRSSTIHAVAGTAGCTLRTVAGAPRCSAASPPPARIGLSRPR